MSGKVGAYYNENDPKAAAWLRELIKRGLIADGEVDTRSIVDVAANDVRGFTQCHWFAGIGAWSYGLRIAGWPDDREIWTGSCPCQPFSAAGKRQGKDDARHLWPELYRLIQERRPVIWFGEQVASPDGLAWLDAVLTDLESASYAAGAVDICAAGFGAPHIRQRLWIVAESGSQRCDGKPVRLFSGQPRQASVETARNGSTGGVWADADLIWCRDRKWRPIESRHVEVADGAAKGVGRSRDSSAPFDPDATSEARTMRLRGYGNAVTSANVAEFVGATTMTAVHRRTE